MKNSRKSRSDFSLPPAADTFVEMVVLMRGKLAPEQRKNLFDRVMSLEHCQREYDVFFMKGAQYNETEHQTAQKLSGAGYYVVFPGRGQLKVIEEADGNTSSSKNDVYIYDKKTYMQSKVELKTIHGVADKTVTKRLLSGSGQAPVVALDIIGSISRQNLIKGIRNGWTKKLRTIMVNYHGHWYFIDREKTYSCWMEKNIKN
jgi:hypothetical protein